MNRLLVIGTVLSIGFCLFSYGFVDSNLVLTQAPLYQTLHQPLSVLVFEYKPWATCLYIGFLCGYFIWYLVLLRHHSEKISGRTKYLIGLGLVALVLSYPAFSYDIFNYMLTAKVAFWYHENPYVVMPIEITNEPWLAFTRAANKVAIYGPTWLGVSSVPFFLGAGKIWLTLIWFKFFNMIWYGGMVYLIWRLTKNRENTIFFAANPLVLFEVLVSGHNDIVMLLLSVGGVLVSLKPGSSNKLTGLALLVVSVFVKGASLFLLPLWFIPKLDYQKAMVYGFWLMVGVFLLTPIREELYPWYAVWFLPFAAFLPQKNYQFIWGLSVAVSFGLLLRHFPYILTREYGGSGPLLRTVVTVVPIILYSVTYFLQKRSTHGY